MSLKILYPQQDTSEARSNSHKLDIVFVHGLNPLNTPNHAEKTWTHDNKVMWPRDLLPKRIDYARIMLFAYNSNVGWDDPAKRPIIFVGHSLGGLVIKQALVLAKQNDRVYGAIRETTRALVFFGTPHRGGNGTTLGQTAASVIKFFTGNRSNDLIDTLKVSSKHLAHLTADFAHQYEDYEFLSVVETRGILRVPLRTVVVDSSSSIIGLAGHRERIIELDRDHRKICKFADLEDCKRVITNLKILANSAMQVHVNTNHSLHDRAESYESTAENSIAHKAQSSKKLIPFTTVNFWQKEETIGRSQVIQQLECFLQDNHSPGILLYGPAGSGKTQVVHEFAMRVRDKYSVFWLSGHDPDAIQDWVNRASYTIKPEFYNVYLANHQKTLRDWLMDEENGNWILIVDDLCIETGLQTVIPSPVAWGKVIITSRGDNHAVPFPLKKLQIPSLLPEEGLSILWSRSRQTMSAPISAMSTASPLLSYIKELCNEPAAIEFAASCVISASPASIASELMIIEEECSPTGPSLDSRTLKWAYIIIDGLSLAETFVLSQLFLFDSRKISEEVIEIVLAPSRSRSDFSEVRFIQRRAFGQALEQLISRHLLQHERDPWTGYYSMPTIVQEMLDHRFASDQGNFESAVGVAGSLICIAYRKRKFSTVSDFQKFMSIINPHYRAILRKSLGRLKRSEVGMYDLSQAMFLYCIMEAVEEGVRRSTRQFWRRWMVQKGHQLSQSSMLNAEDDQNNHTEFDTVPSKLSLISAMEETRSNDTLKQSPTLESIKRALWKALRDSITIGMVGRGWHGIRDDIFGFIRQNRNSRSDTEVSAIIDFVDKGGCEGLIQVVRNYVHGDGFKEEIMAAGADIIHNISKLADDALDGNLLGLDNAAIADAVHDGLEFLMTLTFHATSSAFDAMLVPMKGLLYTMLESPLDGNSPDGFRSIISFAVAHTSESYIQAHALSVGRAFWEILSSVEIWIAAAIANRVNFAVLTSLVPAASPDPVRDLTDELDPRHQHVAALNTRCIQLAREAIMTFHNRLTPAWRLSMRKATYWCLLAEEIRIGSVKDDDHDADGRYCDYYRDKAQWEEVCILLEMTEAVWPLS